MRLKFQNLKHKKNHECCEIFFVIIILVYILKCVKIKSSKCAKENFKQYYIIRRKHIKGKSKFIFPNFEQKIKKAFFKSQNSNYKRLISCFQTLI